MLVRPRRTPPALARGSIRGRSALDQARASGSAFAAVDDRGWGDGIRRSICTMTTVGYGDIAPQTTAGRTIGARLGVDQAWGRSIGR